MKYDHAAITDALKNDLLKTRKTIQGPVGLAAVRFNNDAATSVYIKSQKKLADELDIDYREISFDAEVPWEAIEKEFFHLNKDASMHGIIIHKPLPEKLSEAKVFLQLNPAKDIEGLHPHNMAAIIAGAPRFIPPTVLSVLHCLDCAKVQLYGKNVVIVGYSIIFGKPLSILLADRLATVSITHVGTFDAGMLPSYIKNADIVITAVGKPNLIKGEWIKEGAVVIDAGISKQNGVIAGDVEFEKARKNASFITPVPGGVGSLTVEFLFKNLLYACKS